MPDNSNKLSHFRKELKRRKVFRVVAMYAATAFIILEVVDIISPALSLPSWTLTSVVIVLAIGFPIAAFLSWIFDITPQGLLKTKPFKDDENWEVIQKPTSRKFTLNNIVVAILLIVVCILLYPKIFKQDKSEDGSFGNETTIAVLPLSNLNKSDEQLEYFSDGVTQEIIDELSKVHKFHLSAFSSTAIYKGTDKSLKTIADELGVSLILTGRSRIYNDSVRLSIELVDPEKGKRIWSNRYDDVLTSAIKIQNDIARRVVEELNIELSPEEMIDLDKINTKSHEAFTLYLKAKAEYYDLTEVGFSKSIDMLERAIELDPKYAQAYTLLAWIHILNGQAEIIADADFAFNTVDKALPLIESSISLDSSISDNFLIMGALDLFYLNDLPSAFENVEKSLSLSAWPKLPTNYCICSAISVYAALGKLEKATTLVKQSKITDRSNPFVFSDEGLVLLLQGESEQAINAFKQSTEINDHPYFIYNVGWTYYHIGEFENAIHYLNKTITSKTEAMGVVLAFLSNAHFKLGNIEKSYDYHDTLLERQSSGKPNVNIPLAMVSAGRGETQETLNYLEKAYKEKEYGFAWFLNSDPVFDDLRGNATFIELISRVGFDQ
jgi:TolB-like protein/Tfp pilus assembly protein PilF